MDEMEWIFSLGGVKQSDFISTGFQNSKITIVQFVCLTFWQTLIWHDG